MRIAFWVFMKLLAGLGVAVALYGWGFYLTMTAMGDQTFAALNGITIMFFSVPLMVIPSAAFLFKRLR